MLDTRVELAKIEATYGTDPIIFESANAQLIYQATLDIQYDDVRRNVERIFPGANPKVKTAGRIATTHRVELAGSGVALTPATWGALWLRGCMFAAPSVGVAEVTYPLQSDGDGASLSRWHFKDNLRHKMQGWRGNAQFDFTAGALPFIEFAGISIFDAVPGAQAPGVLVLPTPPAPVVVNSTNTSFSLGGFALLLRSLNINMGLKTVYRDLVGQRAVVFDKAEDGDRRAVTFTIVAETPDPDVKTYFNEIAAQTAQTLSLIHGLTAGNIIEVGSTRCFLDQPSWSVEQGRQMMTMTGEMVPSAAGNEFTLKSR